MSQSLKKIPQTDAIMQRSSKVRFEFFQDIYREADNQLMLQGKIVGTALNERGRPCIPDDINALSDR
jgi:acyl-CoA thioester hydrolase